METYAHINNHVFKEGKRLGHTQTPNYAQQGNGRILFANPQMKELKQQQDITNELDDLGRVIKANDVGDKADTEN